MTYPRGHRGAPAALDCNRIDNMVPGVVYLAPATLDGTIEVMVALPNHCGRKLGRLYESYSRSPEGLYTSIGYIPKDQRDSVSWKWEFGHAKYDGEPVDCDCINCKTCSGACRK